MRNILISILTICIGFMFLQCKNEKTEIEKTPSEQIIKKQKDQAFSIGGKLNEIPANFAFDTNKNLFIGGDFYSKNIDLGGGNIKNKGMSDAFLVKYNENYEYQWDYFIGGSEKEHLGDLTIDENNEIYLAGYFESKFIDFGGEEETNKGSGKIFVLKLDEEGENIWYYVPSEDGVRLDSAVAIDIDSNKNVYVAGYYLSNNMNFGNNDMKNRGANDIFVLKLDNFGRFKWVYTAGFSNWDMPTDIIVDDEQNVYIVGHFSSKYVNFGGGNRFNKGSYDVFVLKLDKNGDYVWDYCFGGNDWDYGKSITLDRNNNVLISGYFKSDSINLGGIPSINKGKKDLFILKLNNEGKYIWSYTAGGKKNESADNIVTDKLNNVLVSGIINSKELFFDKNFINLDIQNQDSYILKLDKEGNYKKHYLLSGNGDDQIYNLNVYDKKLYIIGSFTSDKLSIGKKQIKNKGANDIFFSYMDF